jgi:hypothetical protein
MTVDEQKGNADFDDSQRFGTATFAVSAPAEFRFFRLTQTAPNHNNNDCLVLASVEFFGTLSE